MIDYYIKILSIYFLLLFISIISIKISSPKIMMNVINYVKSVKFLSHFSLIMLIVILVNIKMSNLKSDGKYKQRKRLKDALEQSFVAFTIAIFARLDIVFLPFYFVFVLVYFVHPSIGDDKES